ncbi:MAG TPA: hypothetical protein PK736_10055, partial [Bacteroidia bacterium]|nr:hypothetical protein [Bacteroidia bacterium]
FNSIATAQQGVNNLWYLGYSNVVGPPNYGGITIDFFTSTPTIFAQQRKMDLLHTHSNISDSLGNILFYTNGTFICDATDSIMQNGDSISPTNLIPVYPNALWIPQACLTIPYPGYANKYLLFHSTIDKAWTTCLHLYYSEIDMTLNNGLGAVTTDKNVALINDTLNLGKITACKHGNGRDWWVVCFQGNSDTIYKFLVTPFGIDGPFKQAIGTKREVSYGQIKFSSDGNKFAYFFAQGPPNSTNISQFEILDFDRCSGIFSNAKNIFIGASYGLGGGVEFSPNSQYVYVSNIDSVYQYDVTASNIDSTKIVVAVWDSFYDGGPPFAVLFDPIELAPDGKIYICSGNGTHYLSVINNPDSQGLACNLTQHSVVLPAYYANTLPNHPNYFLGANGLCNNLSYESLESWKVKKVTVFGNPTHDKFTLWFPVDKDVGWLEIYDVNGSCIRRERVSQWSQYKTVDISLFSEGVYFCRMVWPDGEGSVKVVRLE